jgi:translation elongation factor EF-1beta
MPTETKQLIVSANQSYNVTDGISDLDGVQSVTEIDFAEQPIGIGIYQFALEIEVSEESNVEQQIHDSQMMTVVTNQQKVAPSLRQL